MTFATSSGDSSRSVATSIAPTSTSLPPRSPIRSIGTCEFAHSSDTWLIAEAASSGNVCSYCRHSLPSVAVIDEDGRMTNDAGPYAGQDRFKARKALAARAGKVLVVNLQPQIRKVFDIVKAVPVSDVFASVAELDAYLDAMQRKVLEGDDEAP